MQFEPGGEAEAQASHWSAGPEPLEGHLSHGCTDSGVSYPPGVVPTQDVLSMLGDIRRSLEEVRVQGPGTVSF